MTTFSVSSRMIGKLLLLATGLAFLPGSCKKSSHTPVAMVSTLAGSGTFGYVDGPPGTAEFKYPTSLACDTHGNIYVADPFNNCIRKVTGPGQVSTFAGSGIEGYIDGPAGTAQFHAPTGVTCDPQGNVYVVDMYNHCVRKITPDGTVSTFAGTGAQGFSNGTGTLAQFNTPSGIAMDHNGNIYVADQGQSKIRKITPSAVVSTLAGSTVGFADGTGSEAKFWGEYSVACDRQDNVYVADNHNSRIRKITPAGVVTTLAGSTAGSADGNASTAQFTSPMGIACDAQGNLYVADRDNNNIRKITPSGTVSTLAGSVNGYAEGSGTTAQFNQPIGVACDAQGNIYVADYLNSRIRKIVLQ